MLDIVNVSAVTMLLQRATPEDDGSRSPDPSQSFCWKDLPSQRHHVLMFFERIFRVNRSFTSFL